MLKNLLRIKIQSLSSQAHKNSDTIYALASGVNTAISIIRVGGSSAQRSLQLLNKNTKNAEQIHQNLLNLYSIKPRMAHFKNIYNSQGNMIDQCLILYFPPEHSYNNQQIIEFHLHGSRAVVNSVFKQLKSKGFRMADRGQFTKRALLNGKINLIQAQSINDLIKSQSQFQRQIAINNMLGKGKQFLQHVKDQLIRCLANNEAYIDFQEDESDVKADLFLKNRDIVKKVLSDIHKILQNYKNLQILKQGINITIAGKPNVGKSTLINALARKQVAIVSQQPGTTRDILHTQIQCGGIMINLFDTAGLRNTVNRIENQGIRRAKSKIKQSQINLLIVDLGQEQLQERISDQNQRQIQIINKNEVNTKKLQVEDFSYNDLIDKNTILVINKGDKMLSEQKQNVKYFINTKNKIKTVQKAPWDQEIQQKSVNQPSQSYEQFKKYADIIISAQQPEQVNKLLAFVQARVKKEYSLYHTSQQIYFTRQRYFTKLQKCAQLLEKYQEQDRPDIACEYLRESIQQVSEIFGKVDVQDVLDVLFREFCIGK